jgi:RNA polymerase sigma-70 factor (ECF subfamily)
VTVDENFLAARFAENRDHLRAVAVRMLGSLPEAEDAVQETWLRLARTDVTDVGNLGGWLTTVLSRVCLDLLRSRRSRREQLVGDEAMVDGPLTAQAGTAPAAADPAAQAVLADSLGPALLVVLDTLAPTERLAFVLHDLFGMPFDEIAPIVDRSPAAARQLASRARRRVRGQGDEAPTGQRAPDRPGSDGEAGSRQQDAGRARQRRIVDAFLDASRNGRFDDLLALLDPDIEMRADEVAVRMGGPERVTGADAVAQFMCGRARAVRRAWIDGTAGAVWQHLGVVKVAFLFSIDGEAVTGIEQVADPGRIAGMRIDPLGRAGTISG